MLTTPLFKVTTYVNILLTTIVSFFAF